jgi:hypothetical protein
VSPQLLKAEIQLRSAELNDARQKIETLEWQLSLLEGRYRRLTEPMTRHEMAREAGRIAHQKGTAHEWTSEEARVAGKRSAMLRRQRRGV